MMPERNVSKIMKGGLFAGLILMFVGVSMSVLRAGAGSEKVMYAGTLCIVSTPAIVLVYLTGYYIFTKPVKYGIYCLLILLLLIIVILMKV